MVAKRAELVPRFMKTVANLSIEGTAPFIEKTKELPVWKRRKTFQNSDEIQMKIIYVYGGKDHLIENDIQEEVIQKYSLPEMVNNAIQINERRWMISVCKRSRIYDVTPCSSGFLQIRWQSLFLVYHHQMLYHALGVCDLFRGRVAFHATD